MSYEDKRRGYQGLILETTIADNGKFRINIHQWILILLCVWISWPYLNYKTGTLLFIALFLLWFIITDFKWVFTYLTIDIVMMFIWLITLFPYILTGNFHYGALNPKNALISFMLFFFGIMVNHFYMYYKKDPILLGRITFVTLLFYFLSSLQTFLGLRKYPLAARELATGSDSLPSIYYSLGIGGFGFVYSAVFVNILLLYFIFRGRVVYKYVSIIIFSMITLMLLMASYATALLFLFAGVFLLAIIKGKRSFIIAFFLASLLFLFVPKETIGTLLINVTSLFDTNTVLKSKFLDLAQGLVSDSYGDQTLVRGKLYLTSLETFLKNPLFGIYGPFGNSFNASVGGHSGWLDQLAYYGLIGSLPLFAVIFHNFKKQLAFYSNHPYYRFLLTAQVLFIAFGFINPVIYIYQLGFVMFVIAPAIPFLPSAFQRKVLKGKKDENTMGY